MINGKDSGLLSGRRSTASNTFNYGPTLDSGPPYREATSSLAIALPLVPSERTDVSQRSQRTDRPQDHQARYRPFRKICDDLLATASRLDEYVQDEVVADEGLEVIVQIEHLLEVLFDCDWGEGESLQRIVVAIQSQVNNVRWTMTHVEFLKAILPMLRIRYLIDPPFVDECMDLIAEHGLDAFRGVMTGEVANHFRLERVEEP